MNSTIYKRRSPLLFFLVPAFIFLTVYLYYPFVQTIISSFLNIGSLGQRAMGANTPVTINYRRMLHDPELRTALKNTLLLLGATLVFQVGIALILALLVDRIRFGARFFQTVYFFPIVISATALGLMFNLIFLYRGGMINQLLLRLEWLDSEMMPNGRTIVQWLDWKNENHWVFTMFAPVIWQYVGFYFVILLTGLKKIPAELYEAAALDGATGSQRIRYITLPMLRNVLGTCAVLAVMGALKVFDLPWVMFGAGMPQNEGWLLGTYMYDVTFNKTNPDYGCAIAVLIVLLGALLTAAVCGVIKSRGDIETA